MPASWMVLRASLQRGNQTQRLGVLADECPIYEHPTKLAEEYFSLRWSWDFYILYKTDRGRPSYSHGNCVIQVISSAAHM